MGNKGCAALGNRQQIGVGGHAATGSSEESSTHIDTRHTGRFFWRTGAIWAIPYATNSL